MKEFVDYWAPVAAILGFVGQGLLLLVFALGLKQLKIGFDEVELTKKALSVTNERASKERALEFHEIFLTRVMPEVLKARQALRTAKAKVTYEGPVGDFSKGSISKAALAETKKRYLDSIDALNLLEYYAVAFTCGVADESLGFSLDGRVFCAYVSTMYDVIVVIRDDAGFSNWQPIVDLYLRWSKRLTSTELEAQRKKLEQELSDVAGGAQAMKPIGVT